jgi:hypothetical protein
MGGNLRFQILIIETVNPFRVGLPERGNLDRFMPLARLPIPFQDVVIPALFAIHNKSDMY